MNKHEQIVELQTWYNSWGHVKELNIFLNRYNGWLWDGVEFSKGDETITECEVQYV